MGLGPPPPPFTTLLKINKLYSKISFRRPNNHSCHRFERINFLSIRHSTKDWRKKLIGFYLQHLSRTFLINNKNIRLFLTGIDLMVPRVNNNI